MKTEKTDLRCYGCANYLADCVGADAEKAKNDRLLCYKVDMAIMAETPLGEQIDGFWEE